MSYYFNMFGMFKGALSQKSLGFSEKKFAMKCYEVVLYTSMN